ncbi:succinate--CoA ligase subunit beta [Chromatiales bacterium (ex Bugula neritina AB1)]|nr:succinate--CoA ligase subunit beta [Chromatiales bacterium (ex Bugula neritina AB1)]
MDIHEYQAKELLSGFGIRIPKGGLAYSPEQAAYRARDIGGGQWVVKAQVHSGGRGKVGGVRLCKDESAVYSAADELFGSRLHTAQSGDSGKVVYRVYVEGAVAIKREMYLGLVLDRITERIMVVASPNGGIEIEDLSSNQPDQLIRCIVEPAVGMQSFQAREIAFELGIDAANIRDATDIILAAYRAFEELDATMVEINPLVESIEGKLYAVDSKMTFDDNALFRHPEIAELRDKSQEDARETRATDRGLRYVGFDGNIGCIANGAGLGMATLDKIARAGAVPANFLDIGGAASPDKVAKALRLVRSDDNVEVILVNVFAGINRCDWVADGIVQALTLDPPNRPIVVRLAGTNVDQGRKILSRSGLPVIRANTLDEAVSRAVRALGTQVPK